MCVCVAVWGSIQEPKVTQGGIWDRTREGERPAPDPRPRPARPNVGFSTSESSAGASSLAAPALHYQPGTSASVSETELHGGTPRPATQNCERKRPVNLTTAGRFFFRKNNSSPAPPPPSLQGRRTGGGRDGALGEGGRGDWERSKRARVPEPWLEGSSSVLRKSEAQGLELAGRFRRSPLQVSYDPQSLGWKKLTVLALLHWVLHLFHFAISFPGSRSWRADPGRVRQCVHVTADSRDWSSQSPKMLAATAGTFPSPTLPQAEARTFCHWPCPQRRAELET